MLHVTPSFGLAKSLWSNPVHSKTAAMTVPANGAGDTEGTKPVPMKIDANNTNGADRIQNLADETNSREGDTAILKIAGLRDFWNHQMKTQEGKWKQHYEQIMSSQHNIVTETAEVDWEAVRAKFAWRRQTDNEKPEGISNEDWQKLQELRMCPWLVYKHCGLYTRMLLDPESRAIFQEFDFY